VATGLVPVHEHLVEEDGQALRPAKQKICPAMICVRTRTQPGSARGLALFRLGLIRFGQDS
jgi:hypothetical protein